MATVAAVLDSGHLDDELTDLEAKFVELHRKYSQLCPPLRPKGHGDVVPEVKGQPQPKTLHAPPHPELLRSLEELREERTLFVRELARLPEWPPRLQLLAERIRREVNAVDPVLCSDVGNLQAGGSSSSAAAPEGDEESVDQYPKSPYAAAEAAARLDSWRMTLRNFFLRRQASLQGERARVLNRLARFVHGSASRKKPGEAVSQRLTELQMDLEATHGRLQRLEATLPSSRGGGSLPVAKAATGEELFWKSTAYRETTLSSIFRSDVVVCLRSEIYEDHTTRLLRRFMQRMQHLTVSCRYELLGKALEAQQALQQAHGGSRQAIDLVPTIYVLKKRLDKGLRDLAQSMGMKGSLQSDDGHLFDHAVRLQFPFIFEKQKKRMRLDAYPADSTLKKQSSAASFQVPPLTELNDEPRPHRSPYELGPFLKNAHWTSMVFLQPRCDPLVAEQRELIQEKLKESKHESSSGGAWKRQALATAAAAAKTTQQRAARSGGRATEPGRRALVVPEKLAITTGAQSAISVEIMTELRLVREDDKQGVLAKLQKRAEANAKAGELRHQKLNTKKGKNADSEGSEAESLLDKRLSAEIQKTAGGGPVPGQEEDDVAEVGNPFVSEDSPAPEQFLRLYYLLRYLRCRDLRCKLLGLLNRFRFVQQKMAHGVLDAQLRGSFGKGVRPEARGEEKNGRARSRPSPSSSSTGSNSPVLATGAPPLPGLLPVEADCALEVLSGLDRLEAMGPGEDDLAVIDAQGMPVIHDVAFGDLDQLEQEMAITGSYYAFQAEMRRMEEDAESSDSEKEEDGEGITTDYAGVLMDILEAETSFHQAKWDLIAAYLEVYEQVFEPAGQQALAQRIVDIMAVRPCLDLEAAYFSEAYATVTASMQSRTKLLRMVITHQVDVERHCSASLSASCFIPEGVLSSTMNFSRSFKECYATTSGSESKRLVGQSTQSNGSRGESGECLENPQLQCRMGLSRSDEGFATRTFADMSIKAVPIQSAKAMDLLEVFPSLGLAWQVDQLVEDAAAELYDSFLPHLRDRQLLERSCAASIMAQWQRTLREEPEHFLVPSISGAADASAESLDGPSWLLALVEDAFEKMPTLFQEAVKSPPKGQETGRLHRAQGSRKDGTDQPRLHRRPPSSRVLSPDDDSDVFQMLFQDFEAWPHDERVLRMYLNVLEQVRVRRRLDDMSVELQELEGVLKKQAELVETSATLHMEALPELQDLPLSPLASSSSSSGSSKRSALSTEIDKEFERTDFSSRAVIMMYLSEAGLAKLRHMCQYEFANRWLYTVCGQYNTVLLDDLMLRKALHQLHHGAQGVRCMQARRTSDAGVSMVKRLTSTSAMSTKSPFFLDKDKASEEPRPGTCSTRATTSDAPQRPPMAIDFKKLGLQCVFPSTVKAPMRLGLSTTIREKQRMLRQCLTDWTETPEDTVKKDRLVRRLKCRILKQGSLLVAEGACDLAVRLQAAQAARSAQRSLAVVPAEFSPFRFSTAEAHKPLVNENGSLNNVFNVPRDVDVLPLRGLSCVPTDSVRQISKTDAQLPSILSMDRLTDCMQLEVDYQGPSFTSLKLQQVIVPLVSIMYFWNSLRGNALILLEHQLESDRVPRGKHPESSVLSSDAVHARVDADGMPLEGPLLTTWDAMESIRVDFMNLSLQLKGIKSGKTEDILAFLRDRLKVAAWRTGLLLRQGLDSTLEKGVTQSIPELRRWQRYLDGYSLDGSGEMLRLQALEDVNHEETGEEIRAPITMSISGMMPVRDDAPDEAAKEYMQRLALGVGCSEMQGTGLLSVGPVGDAPALGRRAPSCPDKRLDVVCPYLPRFVHALAALHTPFPTGVQATEDQSAVEWVAPKAAEERQPGWKPAGGMLKPVAYRGRAPWRFPGLPLTSLTRGLLLLPESCRRLMSEAHMFLEMKVDAHVASKDLEARNPEAVEVETEFVWILYAEHRLREVSLCAELRIAYPGNHLEKVRLDAMFEEKVVQRMEGKDMDRQQSEEEQGISTPQLPEYANLPGQAENSIEERWEVEVPLEAIRQARKEFRYKQEVLAHIVGEVHKVLLALGLNVYARQIALAEENVKGYTEAPPPEEQVGKRPNPVAAALAASSKIAKAEAVSFFNRLRARSARVRSRSPIDLGDACVIRASDLDEACVELGTRLLQWNRASLEAQRVRRVRRLGQVAETMQQNEYLVATSKLFSHALANEFTVEVTSGIVARSRAQLLQLDAYNQKMQELAGVSLELEHRLSSEIRCNVLKDLERLDRQLKDVQGSFASYLGGMQQTLKQEVRGLKQELFEALQTMSVKNYSLQQRVKQWQDDFLAEKESAGGAAPGAARGGLPGASSAGAAGGEERSRGTKQSPGLPVAKEKDAKSDATAEAVVASCLPEGQKTEIEQLHREISDLTYAVSRMEAHFNTKTLHMRQSFEQQLHTFKGALSSNADLWNTVTELRDRDRILKDELGKCKGRARAAANINERLMAKSQAEVDEAARLTKWKENAFFRFERLLKEERKYDGVDNFDLDKLLQSQKMLDAQILKMSRNADVDERADARIDAEKFRAQTQQAILRRKKSTEQKMTEKAKNKANLIRREIECGDMVLSEGLIGLLTEDYQDTERQIKALEDEVTILKTTLPSYATGQEGRSVKRAAIRDYSASKVVKKHITTFQEQLATVKKGGP
eukprot:TRINITY_DN64965_c0_g1_i1.p1 TRINITY_DN64965_c0_g1~~TRINITY_DN64965_c0_g1_i1.p1  ORF type:complete len:2661 (-),score=763.07 TRINITY_DN64965_c0_g1_i1:747-8729(-)